MTDFAPPPGPPPPKVPEGWKAIWNTQYSEWFYVNIYTKQSQWEKPEAPVYPPGEAPHHNGPPAYAAPTSGVPPSNKPSYGSNNPYANISEDEKLARRLQEEEEKEEQARAGGHHGVANDFYTHPGQGQGQGHGYEQQGYGASSSSSYPPSAQTAHGDSSTTGKAKGLLGKLLGGRHGASSSSHAPYVQPHGYAAQPVYGTPSGYYGSVQPVGYGRPARKQGMGAGGMALGMGGGLLGGALLGSALADAGDGGGFGDGGDGGDFGGDGGDFGGDGGGDFGGGDFGGGDFGGD